ncbi:MAG TPA: hypothetical protein VGJ53_01935 [Micromonosporaceae bacterium]
MKGWLPLALGLVSVVIGALWTLQGLGYVEGSTMTGERIWAIIGPIVGVVGLLLLWVGMRARRRRT